MENTKNSPEDIPQQTALRLCEEIWRANQSRWWTPYGIWCRACRRFSHGDPARLCFANAAGNRGCAQVNARFDQERRS